jgi:hypothetical protein
MRTGMVENDPSVGADTTLRTESATSVNAQNHECTGDCVRTQLDQDDPIPGRGRHFMRTGMIENDPSARVDATLRTRYATTVNPQNHEWWGDCVKTQLDHDHPIPGRG